MREIFCSLFGVINYTFLSWSCWVGTIFLTLSSLGAWKTWKKSFKNTFDVFLIYKMPKEFAPSHFLLSSRRYSWRGAANSPIISKLGMDMCRIERRRLITHKKKLNTKSFHLTSHTFHKDHVRKVWQTFLLKILNWSEAFDSTTNCENSLTINLKSLFFLDSRSWMNWNGIFFMKFQISVKFKV